MIAPAALLAQDDAPDPAAAAEQTLAPWAPSATQFGAIAFTADGSFASVWQLATKDEAEARVRDDCLKYQRGACEVVGFGAEVCAAIATADIGDERKVTYAGGATSPDEAEELALKRCKHDKRTKDTCTLRTVVCGDGR